MNAESRTDSGEDRKKRGHECLLGAVRVCSALDRLSSEVALDFRALSAKSEEIQLTSGSGGALRLCEDRRATEGDRPSDELRETDYRKQFADDCARYVVTFQGLRVLVVGCGNGLDCKDFVSFGATLVHGIDPDSGVGQDFHHSSMVYLNGSAEAMPFKDCSYDVVYSVATMEHIHDIQQAFSEMVRVTKPGGLIYCVAAPLWNSREGHHQFGLFPKYPWIHLRLAKHDVVNYCRERNISKGRYDISVDVDFMFSRYYNRLPACSYLEACAHLSVSQLIDNSLWSEPEHHLPEDVFVELQSCGYSKEELLAVSHKFVARK